jgi:hypothetical protein
MQNSSIFPNEPESKTVMALRKIQLGDPRCPAFASSTYSINRYLEGCLPKGCWGSGGGNKIREELRVEQVSLDK